MIISCWAGLFLGGSAYLGGVGAGSRLMGLPTRPPGLVPCVDSGEYRLRLFDRQAPDGAICARVYFLDNAAEIWIELFCVFHFCILLFRNKFGIISFD
jgi:hypothetical protein